MTIIRDSISRAELRQLSSRLFGNMAKGVVDIGREVVAVDAELHADLEAALLADGSNQNDLWGVNFYPDEAGDGFVEFDSLINVRPSMGNRSRSVEDPGLRSRILAVVARRLPE